MTVSTKQLLDLKDRVKRLDEQRIRAEAAYDEAVTRLHELGYDTVEDAEKALEDMQADILQEEANLANDLDALLDKYPALRG